jgi:hypothetical protein
VTTKTKRFLSGLAFGVSYAAFVALLGVSNGSVVLSIMPASIISAVVRGVLN